MAGASLLVAHARLLEGALGGHYDAQAVYVVGHHVVGTVLGAGAEAHAERPQAVDVHDLGVEQVAAYHLGDRPEHGQHVRLGDGRGVRHLLGQLLAGYRARGHHLGVPLAVVGALRHGYLCGFELDAHSLLFYLEHVALRCLFF